MLEIQKCNSLNNFEPRIIKTAKIQDDPKKPSYKTVVFVILYWVGVQTPFTFWDIHTWDI